METTWGKVMEHEDIIDIIARVTYRKNPTSGLDLEDYKSLAFEAAYQAVEEWDEDVETSSSFRTYLHTKIEYRLRDHLRLIWRQNGWSRVEKNVQTTVTLDEDHWDRIENLYLSHEQEGSFNEFLSDLIHNTGFTQRERVIVAMLAFGATKKEVAQELGVSDGRISQLLREVRLKMYKNGLCAEEALKLKAQVG